MTARHTMVAMLIAPVFFGLAWAGDTLLDPTTLVTVTSGQNNNVINVVWEDDLTAPYAPVQAKCGDTVVFTWQDHRHNLVTKGSGSCDAEILDTLEADALDATIKYTLPHDKSEVTFACTIGDHCSRGQILTFSITCDESMPVDEGKVDVDDAMGEDGGHAESQEIIQFPEDTVPLGGNAMVSAGLSEGGNTVYVVDWMANPPINYEPVVAMCGETVIFNWTNAMHDVAITTDGGCTTFDSLLQPAEDGLFHFVLPEDKQQLQFASSMGEDCKSGQLIDFFIMCGGDVGGDDGDQTDDAEPSHVDEHNDGEPSNVVDIPKDTIPLGGNPLVSAALTQDSNTVYVVDWKANPSSKYEQVVAMCGETVIFNWTDAMHDVAIMTDGDCASAKSSVQPAQDGMFQFVLPKDKQQLQFTSSVGEDCQSGQMIDFYIICEPDMGEDGDDAENLDIIEFPVDTIPLGGNPMVSAGLTEDGNTVYVVDWMSNPPSNYEPVVAMCGEAVVFNWTNAMHDVAITADGDCTAAISMVQPLEDGLFHFILPEAQQSLQFTSSVDKDCANGQLIDFYILCERDMGEGNVEDGDDDESTDIIEFPEDTIPLGGNPMVSAGLTEGGNTVYVVDWMANPPRQYEPVVAMCGETVIFNWTNAMHDVATTAGGDCSAADSMVTPSEDGLFRFVLPNDQQNIQITSTVDKDCSNGQLIDFYILCDDSVGAPAPAPSDPDTSNEEVLSMSG